MDRIDEERDGSQNMSYTSDLGVTEVSARFNKARQIIGKQDNSGRTIAVCYVSMQGFKLIPLALRVAGLVALLASAIFIGSHPFGWLPAEKIGYGWAFGLRNWEMLSGFTWVAAFIVYLMYFVAAYLKNSLYIGQPQTEIHFTRHSKIVKTLVPGEKAFIWDPRVRPYAVVSTTAMPLQMPEVTGPSGNNLSMSHKGAFIIEVADTYKLLEKGGLKNFARQLTETHEGVIKDMMRYYEAKSFNRFLVEPVQISQDVKNNLDLNKLGRTDLTVELITELSEIADLDMSSLDLSESDSPKRMDVARKLDALAQSYGIKIIDYIPVDNTTTHEYLQSLSLPVVSSITRLEQSTQMLKEITEEEIDEERTARVAHKQVGALEITKIIKEIESMTETLKNQKNRDEITESKKKAMANTVAALLVTEISRIEALISTVHAKEINTAGLEKYIAEMESIIKMLEDAVDDLPRVGTVFAHDLKKESILPWGVDIVESLLSETGTNKLLEKLEKPANDNVEENLSEEIKNVERQVDEIKVDEILLKIQENLRRLSLISGVEVENYSLEKVEERINDIAKKADVDVSEDESEIKTKEVV